MTSRLTDKEKLRRKLDEIDRLWAEGKLKPSGKDDPLMLEFIYAVCNPGFSKRSPEEIADEWVRRNKRHTTETRERSVSPVRPARTRRRTSTRIREAG